MDVTPLRVAALVLNHHGIPICTIGELALNYYNVPRVCHDVEICISESTSSAAADVLCCTGLFEMHEMDPDFNNYTEYKRGVPRVRTTAWCQPQSLVIFQASVFGLDPVKDALLPPSFCGKHVYISKEMELLREDIANLHLPKLAPLLKGMARRFLDTRDDPAMMAVEQLVDGMDLDETWAVSQLGDSDPAVLDLILRQVKGKKWRIDYFSENEITCFVSSREEAGKLRLIPGYI
ncbi:uncharacterized protein UV8b_05490 [Ustilaginoidea virens]|uniref:Uncharacterized protein n=1 Tax=Ustilaginoidea virens TaxID=1159556 RepID=A0A063C2P7_USTVR|nr:uncharacterized protein UV8b_05490 [Ustilaginoidea virens]QUC21247.1 hypothetical protein UV8b_05490 [Ustilaginoidea virens]GAO17228.1 hypothetical protein UVI_02057350 [Ustilaginoidea virens]